MKIKKGRWDDNVRIYYIDPLDDWSETITVFMDKSLSTFKWRKPEVGSISFRGLSLQQTKKISEGFIKASELAESMYREAGE